jgi:hypothetical protein
MKSAILAAAFLLAAASTAMAGSPPIDSAQTPDSVAAACSALGAKGERAGNGCVNTETGGAVTCSDGRCTEYFPDPRYKSIKALLDANREKPQKQAL